MATNKELLQQALNDNAAAIARLQVNPRPDGSVDGTSNQWTSMRISLIKERKLLLEALQNEDGPFEITTYPPGS